ncbi:hypothetical protein DCO58_04740 [Helicobacter saguini]|uniref:Uncharacterized protein n=1 Tax=Helicobacter saguini TaxID=1548018 RepID=A0A347VSW1_9HELI|nr:hypothetical protein [Helicobacter saguini]MWV62341.1 hypothetical protein [Helicobacter saguini]MWV66988.1 hypothetical protein [Helicobacter saguini]MWV69336.1 hypothetical protein [Helicobacter saguini]MWV71109.1 hypothetical protein [Helicobacter saguini]TLD94995.1 hypothetical protein LS64_003505 [Helicobacter saguini]
MQKLARMESDDVRIHLICNNMFLSLAFSFYLKGHLSSIDEADFIITDIAVLREKYTHLPICIIGQDLIIPCSVYEMFSQLHEFYSRVNAKQAEIFQKDIEHLQKFEKKHKDSKKEKNNSGNKDIVENIKQKKMQDLMKNIDPSLSGQVELLFNELSQKIYDTLENSKKSSEKK